jgi:methylenetetrahydrofolate reductase (NADPH)
VGPSLAFLRKQGGLRNLLRLSASTAASLYDALSPRIGEPQLGIAGLHYFTFNRLLDTWRWHLSRSDREVVRPTFKSEVTPQ